MQWFVYVYVYVYKSVSVCMIWHVCMDGWVVSR